MKDGIQVVFAHHPSHALGADVTHPGGDSLEPSIAAVVGSTNEFGCGYAAEFSVQPGRQEIISDLHHMVKVSKLFLLSKNQPFPTD